MDKQQKEDFVTRTFLTFVSIASCCLGCSSSAEAGIFFGGHFSSGVRTADFDGSGLIKLVNTPTAQDVAVDLAGNNLFWSNPFGAGAGVYRADSDGANQGLLVATSGFAWGLALDIANKHIYWSETNDGKIRRINFDGTGALDVLTGLSSPREIEIDAGTGTLYWAESGSGKIRSSDLSGNNPVDLITGLPTGSFGVTGLGLDLVNQKIYWAEDASTESIGRANLDGTAQEVFYKDTSLFTRQPISVAVDPIGGFVYWADFTPNEVHRMKIDGTGFETILDVTRPIGIVVAVDLSSVPEPASLAVWSVLGLVSVGAARRKKSRIRARE